MDKKTIVIVVATAIVVGQASISLIKSAIADLITPLIFIVLVKGTKSVSSSASKFFGNVVSNKGVHFTNFVVQVITWLIVVMIAFAIMNWFKHIPFERFETDMFIDAGAPSMDAPMCPPCPPCPATAEPPMNDVMEEGMDYSNFYLNDN